MLPDNNGSYGSGPRIVRGAIVDLNIEGAANLRFSPSTPAGTWSADGQYFGPYQNSRNYLGYSAVLRVGELGSSVEGIGGTATSPMSISVEYRVIMDAGEVSETISEVAPIYLGGPTGNLLFYMPASSLRFFFDEIEAGTHTFKLQAKSADPAISAYAQNVKMLVREI